MDVGPEHADLAPDPAAPVDLAGGLMAVAGILGESLTDTSVRIYLDAALTTFYDIPKSAVRGRRRIQAAGSPFGVPSTVLHVEQGAQISVRRTSSRTIDQEFLAGDFTQPHSFRNLTWSAPKNAGGASMRVNTNANDCYRTSPNGGGCTQATPCQI